MELKLVRIAKKANYTIGNLYIDGKWFCNTLEPTWRGLTSNMSVQSITAVKKLYGKGKTAIPVGTYAVDMNIVSPKYSVRQVYQDLCKGRVPRLRNVKGFEGILIHIGNDEKDTEGCILVGLNTKVGKVLNSTETFKKLYKKLLEATDTITIEVS